MKIAVVGSGAMGSLIGGILVGNNEDVIFIDPWKEHVDAMNEKGLTMKEVGQEKENIKVKATINPKDAGNVDVVVFLVKGPKTVEAIKEVLPIINDKTLVVSFQNGLGNGEKLSEFISKDNIGFGVIDFSAVLVGPGEITYQLADAEIACNTYTGKENIIFNEFIKIMNDSGINAYICDDSDYRIWKKLVINANYNILCGILGINMGNLIDQEYSWTLMKGITREIVELANKKGIQLDYEESMTHLRELGGKVRAHYPSLSQDVAREVETEVEALNGAIVQEGRKMGIKTPYNEVVYNLMKIIENTYKVGKEFNIKK